MCGIAGVISWDEKYRVNRETLQRMSSRIAHRGPDGEGFYLNHEQEVTADRPQCGFAFRRLAILDPDPRAMQPFTIGDKTLVFNGELYNFRELRAELTTLRPEYRWRTTGDAEVLLLAYDVWGEKCLGRLNGMFAFAIWDDQEKALFLARDRMGQKPLYLATPKDGATDAIAFASELAGLRVLNWFDDTVRPDGVAEYLRWGYQTGLETIYAGAMKLESACWSRVSSHDRLTPSTSDGICYFDCNDPDGFISREKRSIRDLVKQAVRRQLVSDVPVGCLLSGGIDSSVIAACMQSEAPPERPVRTFSIAFDDPRYDESGYARAVAEHLRTEHREFRVRPDAAEDLPKLAAVLGEPFADSSVLPTHYLARETRRDVKVALGGDGGDELFGGYNRYRVLFAAEKLGRLSAPAGLALSVITSVFPTSHPKSKVARAKRLAAVLGPHRTQAGRYSAIMRIFDEQRLDALYPELPSCAAGSDGDAIASLYMTNLYQYGDARAALAVDRVTYLPDDLLAKVDRASMLHGLEVRSPFMDHELVQFTARLTTDQLLKRGPKRMLREAFADDLPAWVFKRKKMGFAVPIGEWFRGELRAMLRDHLFAADSFARQHFNMKVVERLVDEHEQGKVDHSQRLYALLMLELWWRTAR